MSLRARLLAAIAIVTLIALALSAVVTFQQLRSFLYERVDQSLEQAHAPFEQAAYGSFAGQQSPRPFGLGGQPPAP
ncbi:MAG TPA: hypothetical protein VEJ87_02750, partial [Acidimicrobiales bacterium]|nr:hypothetical protein [Acidimicrobiales bacterium]